MDRKITIEVKDRVATVAAPDDASIICGNSEYTITFDLDDEWDGVETKTARFKYFTDAGHKHTDVPFVGDKVDVPVMVNTRKVEVGIFAGDLTSSTGATIPCTPCIRCGSGDEVEPPQDKYDALMELIQNGGAGLSEQQAQDLAANTKARHSHSNKTVLDKLKETDGALTYNGKPIGGSGAPERPTAVYVYDFVEDYRMWNTDGNVLSLYITEEEATDEEKTMVGKEIAEVELERSTGEWVSLKDMAEVDLLPFISMQNHIIRTSFDDLDSIVFLSVYYPSTAGWLKSDFMNAFLLKMRVTYYTD